VFLFCAKIETVIAFFVFVLVVLAEVDEDSSDCAEVVSIDAFRESHRFEVDMRNVRLSHESEESLIALRDHVREVTSVRCSFVDTEFAESFEAVGSRASLREFHRMTSLSEFPNRRTETKAEEASVHVEPLHLSLEVVFAHVCEELASGSFVVTGAEEDRVRRHVASVGEFLRRELAPKLHDESVRDVVVCRDVARHCRFVD